MNEIWKNPTEWQQDRDEDQHANESRPVFDLPIHRSDGESRNNDDALIFLTPAASPPHLKATGSSFERQGMYDMPRRGRECRIYHRLLEDVLTLLWLARKGAQLTRTSLRLDYFAFLRRNRIWG